MKKKETKKTSLALNPPTKDLSLKGLEGYITHGVVYNSEENDDKYRKIFAMFNMFTKKDSIFLDNDGEVIKAEWDRIVNVNS